MRRVVGIAVVLVLLLAVPVQAAGKVTARVSTPTCDKPSFRFRVENSSDRYRKFTVVLWHADGWGEHLFLRDKVPAWGGIRGVVNPDWTKRNRYVVEVFRTWEWKPWSHEWRLRTWLAGSSATLECE